MSSIFFIDVNDLPKPTVWFYFTLLLAIALFFKFSRVLSMRNLDIIATFLPMPGLLLLIESNGDSSWGYGWLMGMSAFLFVRALWDLALVRRPALSPNLSVGGLSWLAGALFLSLIVVAVQMPDRETVREKTPPLAAEFEREGERLLTGPQVPRALAVICHLSVAAGLAVVGWRVFRELHSGIAAATLYLLLPYTYLFLPSNTPSLQGQWYHVWPMALLVWAVAVYRWPTVAGLLIGLAAGSVFFPVLLFPLWCTFYGRNGAGRFSGAFILGVGLCLAWVAGVTWWRDEPTSISVVLPIDLKDWLPWVEPSTDAQGLWKGVHWAYRMPVFVLYLALLLATIIWPSPKELAHVLPLSTALLIGTQFWVGDQGGVHILWYLPFFLMLTFRPNLSALTPPNIMPESDWLHRMRRSIGQFFSWLLGRPAQMAKTK